MTDTLVTLAVGIGFGLVAWVNVRAGLWLIWLIIPTYLVKLTLFGLPTNLFELGVIVLALVYLTRAPRAAGRTLVVAIRSLGWAVLILLLGVIVGVIVSPDLKLGLGIFKGWFMVPLLLYWLTVSQLRARDIKLYLVALVLSTIPLSLVALWQVATQTFITVDSRASGWFVSANYLSMYLVPILILGLILVHSPITWYRRLAYLAWWLGGLALYFSFSFGGWLAIISALIIWGAMTWRHWWRWWVAAPIVALVGAIATQSGTPRFERMLDLSERSSVSVRWQVWQTAWLMIKEHVITGIGLGQFRDQYLAYANRLFAPPWETAILHAHNLYLQFWINTGVLGLVGWIWLTVNFFRRSLRRLSPETGVLAAAMSAILIHGLADTTYWKNDLAALFWLIFAMMMLITQPQSAAD